MMSDNGKRVDDPKAYQSDLSTSADCSSIKAPTYTTEAEDVALEGRFSIDVFIQEDGLVKESEPVKKIGYGMDERIKESLQGFRCKPKRDKLGRAVSTWHTIYIQLKLN
jgi:hypothetical protein